MITRTSTVIVVTFLFFPFLFSQPLFFSFLLSSHYLYPNLISTSILISFSSLLRPPPLLSSFFSFLLSPIHPLIPSSNYTINFYFIIPNQIGSLIMWHPYSCILVRESQGADNVPQDPTGPGNLMESSECVAMCNPICPTPPTPLSLRGPSRYYP